MIGCHETVVGPHQQSGVVPYLYEHDCLKLVLITSSSGLRWIFPKGTVEPGMSAWDSAAKEAYEEAGVLGRVQRRVVGEYRCSKAGMPAQVAMYPLRVDALLDFWQEDRRRQRLIVSPGQAYRLLHYKLIPTLHHAVQAVSASCQLAAV